MITLAIRTDSPVAVVRLINETGVLDEIQWQAHRELSDTIFNTIDELLARQSLVLTDIEKIGVYGGPGSFTGLRIGVTVANSLAYSLSIPVAAFDDAGWQKESIDGLKTRSDSNSNIVIPEYGSEANITKPRK